MKHELMVDVRFGNVGVEVLAFDEAQEELVHDLDVRPSDFQTRARLPPGQMLRLEGS